MKALILSDATYQGGSGHLMRALALAQGLKEAGGEAVFLSYCESEALLGRIKKEGFRIYASERPTGIETAKDILRKESPGWAVLDGYSFASDFQKEIKDMGLRLLVVDDFAHLEHYHADIILNQNYGAETFKYDAEPYTRILAGTKYVLLRKEFLKYRGHKRAIPDIAKKLLITLGGADPGNHTLKVMRAVNLIERPLRVKVVVGASNPNFDSIKTKAGRGRHKIEILKGVEDMAPLMAWADVAVSAGGTTVWELAFMGVPSLLCIIADNQENSVNALSEGGVFASLGWLKDRTEKETASALEAVIKGKPLRQKMHEKANALVDGKGVYRVISEMKGLPEKTAFSLKRDFEFENLKFINFINLSPEEKRTVLNWRNSDDIRRWMFTDRIISEEEHLGFIEGLKRDENNFYWMALVDDAPSGVVDVQKADFENRSGRLGIYSVRKGSGKSMLWGLMHLWFDIMDMRTLKCELMEGNERAYKLYTDFGFAEDKIHKRYIEKNGVRVRIISMTTDRGDWLKKGNRGAFETVRRII